MSWHSQNSVGWWSFSSLWCVSHQLFSSSHTISHSLTTYKSLDRFHFNLLARTCLFHNSHWNWVLLSRLSFFLFTHNNKLSVTLSWQKSLLWIAKMNRMKNDGLFAITGTAVGRWVQKRVRESLSDIQSFIYITFHVQCSFHSLDNTLNNNKIYMAVHSIQRWSNLKMACYKRIKSKSKCE